MRTQGMRRSQCFRATENKPPKSVLAELPGAERLRTHGEVVQGQMRKSFGKSVRHKRPMRHKCPGSAGFASSTLAHRVQGRPPAGGGFSIDQAEGH